MNRSFENQVALVTGVGSRIGLATAKAGGALSTINPKEGKR